MSNFIETFDNVDLDRISIALWGPTNSGKTTLWWAFWRQLSLLNRNLSQQGYELKLVNKDGNIIADPTKLEPTQLPKHDLVLFQRVNLSDKMFLSQGVNTHAHWVGVLDSPGKIAVEALDNSLDNDPSFIRKILSTSKCILIILNQGNLPSPDDYYNYLGKLRTLLADRPRYIAACITKIDDFGEDLTELNPELLLAKHFGNNTGQKVFNLIGNDGFVGDGHSVLLCATSALGVIKGVDGKNRPNFDGATKTVKDLNAWKPEKVEQPFFWLFEKIERERLKQSNLAGLFYHLYSKEFQEARHLSYVSYSELLRTISWAGLSSKSVSS